MNDKIRELAEQAGFENGHQDRNGNSYSYELEKFAELIVRECLSLSSDLYPFDAMDAAGVGAKSQYGSAALLRVYENTNDQYYDAIKKHFGVE
jgi:hypothetical protein